MKTLSSVLLAFLLAGCGRAIGTAGDDPVFAGAPAGHPFVFEVTHELDRDGGPVGFALTDSDYLPAAERIRYWVSFSASGEEVEISPIIDDDEVLFRGTLTSSRADRWEFRIDDSWAGGHFHAWREDERLRAELTFYGSGLPVVASFRGALIPADE